MTKAMKPRPDLVGPMYIGHDGTPIFISQEEQAKWRARKDKPVTHAQAIQAYLRLSRKVETLTTVNMWLWATNALLMALYLFEIGTQ